MELLRERRSTGSSGTWGLKAVGASLFLVLLGACQKEAAAAAPIVRKTEMPDANFELYVLNASQQRKSVDIQVHIDGRLVVDETFSSEASGPVLVSIPPHKVFKFRLEPGPHILRASSSAGGATLEERFEHKDRQWALLGYDYWSGHGTRPPPGQFELSFQSTPIRFQ